MENSLRYGSRAVSPWRVNGNPLHSALVGGTEAGAADRGITAKRDLLINQQDAERLKGNLLKYFCSQIRQKSWCSKS